MSHHFQFQQCPPIFVLLKLTCLVTHFERKLGFSRNLWDISYDFQTPCVQENNNYPEDREKILGIETLRECLRISQCDQMSQAINLQVSHRTSSFAVPFSHGAIATWGPHSKTLTKPFLTQLFGVNVADYLTYLVWWPEKTTTVVSMDRHQFC